MHSLLQMKVLIGWKSSLAILVAVVLFGSACHAADPDSTIGGEQEDVKVVAGHGMSEAKASRDLQDVAILLGLLLVDTRSLQNVGIVTNGTIIAFRDVRNMTTPAFNINVLSIGAKHVKFRHNGVSVDWDNTEPFTLCGDSAPLSVACPRLGEGKHEITVIPASERQWVDGMGIPFHVSFRIVADCPPEYRKIAPHYCLDECATGMAGCSPDATCTNTAGMGVCKCKEGYYGDGKVCEYADSLVWEDAVDIPTSDMDKILSWIKFRVAQIKNPFCWKGSYGRGVGEVLSVCPSDRDKIGALCYSKCPSGYERWGVDCHQKCPAGFRNDGLFCRKVEYGRGAGYAAWDWWRCERDHGRGNCEWWAAMIYPKCAAGFSAFGCCLCRPQVDCNALGMGGQLDLSCAKKLILGDPTPLWCPSHLEQNGGLCYPFCAAKHYGVGPMCWTSCDSHQWDCAAACAIDQATCAFSTLELVTAPLMLAWNIGTMGLGSAVSGAATTTIKTAKGATQVVSGTTKVGRALVDLANVVQKVGTKSVAIGKKVYNSKLGHFVSESAPIVVVAGSEAYTYYKTYRDFFADDFAGQTSPAINDEINRRYHPRTALFIKKAWADVHFSQLSEAYGWAAADISLGALSIVDPTGITGVLAAYVKPICQEVMSYPCTSADLTCTP